MWLSGDGPGRDISERPKVESREELLSLKTEQAESHPAPGQQLMLLRKEFPGQLPRPRDRGHEPAAPAGPDTCSTLQFASQARYILLSVRIREDQGSDVPGARELLSWEAGGCVVGWIVGCSFMPLEFPRRAGAAMGRNS